MNHIEPNYRQPPKTPGRRRLVLFLLLGLFLLAILVPIGIRLTGGSEPGVSQAAHDPREKNDLFSRLMTEEPTEKEKLDELFAKLCRPSPVNEGGKLVQRAEGRKITYTLDPDMQKSAENIFSQYKVPYGAFVALDPTTGKVLALAEYSASDPEMKSICMRATYPAASLIKVITSAAALKTGKVNPSTLVRFEGNPYRLSQRKVSPNNARNDRSVTTLTEALGKSNNVVFAKMGVNVVGAGGLQAELNDFGFNREIPFEFPLQKSTALVPQEFYELAKTSAGFGDVYVSPVHAALIAASVANGGAMMKPYIVESVTDASGNEIYRGAPEKLSQVIDPSLAATLAEMMKATVLKGTSSKIFNRKQFKKLVTNIGVAGKTGSLTGEDPPGRYEWFIGFAPTGNPRVAVAALVVNKSAVWHIKGTYTAAEVMREHFGL